MLKYLPQIFISHKIKYSVSRLSMILVQPTLLAHFSSNFSVNPVSQPHGTSYYLQESYSSIPTLCCFYLHCKVCSLQQSLVFPISLTHISPLKLSWKKKTSAEMSPPLWLLWCHQLATKHPFFVLLFISHMDHRVLQYRLHVFYAWTHKFLEGRASHSPPCTQRQQRTLCVAGEAYTLGCVALDMLLSLSASHFVHL